uniref:Uncharacterized protein n=1 Tax=Arundo donax TaxID=35708 RepID=A0A0A8YHB8_ARUDO
MDKEQMKMAILKQEQIFQQQVHELHRLYHVQTQLMQQMQTATALNRAPAIIDVKPKPQLNILHREKPTNPQQFISFSISEAPAPAPEPAEECSLELTLATGPSSSSSGNAGRQHVKLLKTPSNSDSGTTAVSSTSTDSELAQFRDVDVTAAARFGSRRMNEIGQGAWMYQCLRLKTA